MEGMQPLFSVTSSPECFITGHPLFSDRTPSAEYTGRQVAYRYTTHMVISLQLAHVIVTAVRSLKRTREDLGISNSVYSKYLCRVSIPIVPDP